MNSIPDKKVGGISAKARAMLTTVIDQTKGCFTVKKVEQILRISSPLARKYVFRWAQNGWIQRIHRGVYLALGLTTEDNSAAYQDPWVIAEGLFSPCYIGGWTAAHHWGFTDQLFNQTLILSTRPALSRKKSLGGFEFVLKKISSQQMFGLEAVWKDRLKVFISDPHKTIIDILDNPLLGGGIRSVTDILWNYLQFSQKDLNLLWEYALKMENRTIFKRLGYLLSILEYENLPFIEKCRSHISKGYSMLDPSIKEGKFIRKWALHVPNQLHGSS